MIRAAQYVRMSTEHQRYSIEAQSDANAAYAQSHDYAIVRTFSDAGISGLRLRGRNALQALLAQVVAGHADYKVVLVYDVSRWGRFQDPDEAGHYEFLCRQAGVRVEYTSEAFSNDQSLATGLIKHLKRAMAAEYSRELSVKVARAKQGLSRKGYWVGGACAFGFRRRMVHPDGRLGQVLEPGERKALQGARIVLVEGPEPEVATVRRVFREYLIHGLRVNAIARRLNAEGVAGPGGAPWTKIRVIRLLENEAYSGVLVTGRSRTRMRRIHRSPPDSVVRIPGGCPALVSRKIFELTQQNLRCKPQNPSNALLLDQLRSLWRRHGRLSAHIINADPDTYSVALFQKRFGGVMAAYELIGYHPSIRAQAALVARKRQTQPGYVRPAGPTDDEMLAGVRDLLAFHGRLTRNLIDLAPHLPCGSTYAERFGGMEQLYALVGYEPAERQRRGFRARSPLRIESAEDSALPFALALWTV